MMYPTALATSIMTTANLRKLVHLIREYLAVHIRAIIVMEGFKQKAPTRMGKSQEYGITMMKMAITKPMIMI